MLRFLSRPFRLQEHLSQFFPLSFSRSPRPRAHKYTCANTPRSMPALHANIARRLTPQPVKIRADIEATCFSYAGIDAIRSALGKGEALSTEQIPIKIRLVAPPLYVVVSNATDKAGALERLDMAIERIGEELKEEGGELVVKMKVGAAPFSLFPFFRCLAGSRGSRVWALC